MANLFTSQTPVITDADDGSPSITTATTVRFAQEGTVTGIRFYATTTVSGTWYWPLAASSTMRSWMLTISRWPVIV